MLTSAQSRSRSGFALDDLELQKGTDGCTTYVSRHSRVMHMGLVPYSSAIFVETTFKHLGR